MTVRDVDFKPVLILNLRNDLYAVIGKTEPIVQHVMLQIAFKPFNKEYVNN